MSNVIITGDVHLHDYRSFNLFGDPQFRLKQFDKLADRLLCIREDVDAEALLVAGDFLHVANPRPYIVNAAFNFLEKIAAVMPVYLTHGQHDYDSRTAMDGEHTLLTLCNHIPNVYYLHQEDITIGGRSFYFLGWEPEWRELIRRIERPVDILIGHATPDDVAVGQRGLRMLGGVDFEGELPFTTAFLGDIHYHQSRDNWVIPGTPIQHSYNDKPAVGVIVLDTSDLAWRHYPTIDPGTWDFLQLVITDDAVEDPYVVTRTKTSTEVSRVQERVDKSVDTMYVIETAVKDAGLEELHGQLMNTVPKDVRSELNLLFELEEVKIRNFRSVENFEWSNIDSGVKLVSGKNGTGKSTLVSAIMFGLTGEGEPRKLTRAASKQMEVEVSVRYNGLRHTIRRGWSAGGKTRYFIEGQEQNAESQNVLKKAIIENLPFLNMMDLMYHRQDRPGFLASYNYTSRVELVTRVLGLRIIDALYQAAQLQTVAIDRKLIEVRQRSASVAAILEQESLVDFTSLEMVDEATEKALEGLRERVEDALKDERKRHQEAVMLQTSLVDHIRRTTSDVSSLERRRVDIEQRKCYTCGQGVDVEKSQEILEQIDIELDERRTALADFQNELTRLEENDIVSDCLEKINKLQKKVGEVASHIGEITALRDHNEGLTNLKESIETARADMESIQREEESLRSANADLTTYKRMLDKNGPVMRSLLGSVSEILSSDLIRVRSHKELVSGEIRPDFGVDMLVESTWINYDELSGGQQSIADLTILEKLVRIVGGVGLLVFDETFKFLDNENLELTVDLIKSLECHSIFIVSHAEGFPYWDLSIQTRLASGITSYVMR